MHAWPWKKRSVSFFAHGHVHTFFSLFCFGLRIGVLRMDHGVLDRVLNGLYIVLYVSLEASTLKILKSKAWVDLTRGLIACAVHRIHMVQTSYGPYGSASD